MNNNKIEIVVLTIQILVMLVLIFTSLVCLLGDIGDKNVWITVLAGSVGILIPAPFVIQSINL